MSDFVVLFGAVMSLIAAVVSSVLVYKATRRGQDLAAQAQTFDQYKVQNADLRVENASLRSDIEKLDAQRRADFDENVRLLRHIERLRAWGYQLVRLLTNNGISDVPPEPEEAL